MEYMEQQMQNYIEAGISEADRCYAHIAELEELNQELAATVEALRDTCSYWINQAKPSGDCSKSEYNAWLALGYQSNAMTKPAKQHLAEIRANAAIKGWWACWEWVDSDDRDKLTLIPAADQYADSIRKAR